MTPDLQTALHNVLLEILSVLAIAIGYYGRKLMLALEAKAVSAGAHLAAQTKMIDEETAKGILRGLVLAADNKLLANILKSGAAKEQWIVDEAAKKGIKVSLAEVKAAYETLKIQVGEAGAV